MRAEVSVCCAKTMFDAGGERETSVHLMKPLCTDSYIEKYATCWQCPASRFAQLVRNFETNTSFMVKFPDHKDKVTMPPLSFATQQSAVAQQSQIWNAIMARLHRVNVGTITQLTEKPSETTPTANT